ncbi:vitamin B12 ABC transporter ATP-binding protein BtuD [Xenorhabdus bovienii]|uniref:Vitamin B12 import ATP-binding protein BtuD n=1 Tax=Xenorhabdus bovienii str. Intermedium TaxID=1379677 RepID=A0A077QLG9_XENBV|nr:vitamin B12 ABC transporter ATP-binding protein BtuD [Xenorhabdus bovienii]MDE9455485.1 vitamin B12 ABC transporter ATP-binding protein BtuD [Xenorhabdus bovienii]MDE9483421.1 vitamin B12 ABC transporter ATP-binding protein BtuD [Xenorhabdus bovienii]MDE9542295.1 vitamin B12 ABC transporter ATP-binding protein BtuD [Xenorhabdus bovienii]MDE9557479.1 vitamin B12 ABC transporter ATP-binding protein BtuD [Xenorhabdus bovienii]MDE9564142.1 vitamin B12 ABC transporter ATP-binding protein BtuD [X
MTCQPILELNNITVDKRLTTLSESVIAKEQIHLVGLNGSGKSTLLSAIAGILPYSGKIHLNGRNLCDYRQHELAKYRAWFSQSVSVPIMPVYQYLDMYRPDSAPLDQSESVLYELCRQLKLTSLLSSSIGQLSGGEWQRVRLAGVFLQIWPELNPNGKLLLLDEPTNNLDITQQAVLDQLIKQFCSLGGSVLMSSHDLNHTYEQATSVWLLSHGKLLVSGIPQNVMTNQNLSKIFEVNIRHIQNNSYKLWRVDHF